MKTRGGIEKPKIMLKFMISLKLFDDFLIELKVSGRRRQEREWEEENVTNVEERREQQFAKVIIIEPIMIKISICKSQQQS